MLLNIRKQRRVVEIPLIQIRPSRLQARKHYDPDEMRELAISIRHNGVIQPITVRKVNAMEYELIAGERRLRACALCGKTKIPCIIVSCTDDQAERYALEENLQRTDLNFFEEAQGIIELMNTCRYSEQEAARQLGRRPASIEEKLTVLRLDDEERELILKSHLTEKHACALLRIENKTERRMILSEIIERSMNVSQTRRMIDNYLCQTAYEKRRYQRRKGVIRDIRLFENTIRKALLAIRAAGLEPTAEQYETDDYIEYVLRIPKQRSTANTMTA